MYLPQTRTTQDPKQETRNSYGLAVREKVRVRKQLQVEWMGEPINRSVNTRT